MYVYVRAFLCIRFPSPVTGHWVFLCISRDALGSRAFDVPAVWGK